ncbi:uncharacterized protein Dvar_22380 [Desulfosarcina variabilis str. Montpellier]
MIGLPFWPAPKKNAHDQARPLGKCKSGPCPRKIQIDPNKVTLILAEKAACDFQDHANVNVPKRYVFFNL